MINDVKVDSYLTWKYLDDTTVAEIVPRGDVGTAQRAVSTVAEWTVKNNMQLNADKCKELIIDFKKNIHNFSPLTIEDLPVVTISNGTITYLSASRKRINGYFLLCH